MKTPWNKLPAKARKAILEGSEEQVHVRYKNRYGRTRSYYAEFEGVMPFLHRRLEQTESDQMKERYDGYMRDTPCPACGGARLRPEILSVTIAAGDFGSKSIAEVCELSISDCADFLNSLTLGSREEAIAGQVLKEVQARLGFLLDVGSGIPFPLACRGHVVRWRSPANSLGNADRFRTRRCFVRARRAVHRAAPA